LNRRHPSTPPSPRVGFKKLSARARRVPEDMVPDARAPGSKGVGSATSGEPGKGATSSLGSARCCRCAAAGRKEPSPFSPWPPLPFSPPAWEAAGGAMDEEVRGREERARRWTLRGNEEASGEAEDEAHAPAEKARRGWMRRAERARRRGGTAKSWEGTEREEEEAVRSPRLSPVQSWDG